mmetsp:Transcript_31488/g.56499  ORF Transcript_31488/g.56499 Transcript_31488/m.56499 type:complete len:235 (-) Transcript_31488:163-867(-)
MHHRQVDQARIKDAARCRHLRPELLPELIREIASGLEETWSAEDVASEILCWCPIGGVPQAVLTSEGQVRHPQREGSLRQLLDALVAVVEAVAEAKARQYSLHLLGSAAGEYGRRLDLQHGEGEAQHDLAALGHEGPDQTQERPERQHGGEAVLQKFQCHLVHVHAQTFHVLQCFGTVARILTLCHEKFCLLVHLIQVEDHPGIGIPASIHFVLRLLDELADHEHGFCLTEECQ